MRSSAGIPSLFLLSLYSREKSFGKEKCAGNGVSGAQSPFCRPFLYITVPTYNNNWSIKNWNMHKLLNFLPVFLIRSSCCRWLKHPAVLNHRWGQALDKNFHQNFFPKVWNHHSPCVLISLTASHSCLDERCQCACNEAQTPLPLIKKEDQWFPNSQTLPKNYYFLFFLVYNKTVS